MTNKKIKHKAIYDQIDRIRTEVEKLKNFSILSYDLEMTDRLGCIASDLNEIRECIPTLAKTYSEETIDAANKKDKHDQ